MSITRRDAGASTSTKTLLGRAVAFIAQFRKLYALERQAQDLTPENRQQLRQQQAAPIWEELRQQAVALQPHLLPQSSLAKAVNYLVNEYQALIGYLADSRYRIDNNLIENSIRVPAVGRRRWLFIGHPDAGWRSAVIYSFIVSCRRRGINPQEYLTDVLQRLPGMNITQIEVLLPEHWKPTSRPSDQSQAHVQQQPPMPIGVRVTIAPQMMAMKLVKKPRRSGSAVVGCAWWPWCSVMVSLPSRDSGGRIFGRAGFVVQQPARQSGEIGRSIQRRSIFIQVFVC